MSSLRPIQAFHHVPHEHASSSSSLGAFVPSHRPLVTAATLGSRVRQGPRTLSSLCRVGCVAPTTVMFTPTGQLGPSLNVTSPARPSRVPPSPLGSCTLHFLPVPWAIITQLPV